MASEPATAQGRRRRTRGRRIALGVWAAIATFAVLLALDGLWAGATLLRNLTRARSQLAVGIESVVTGDAEAAIPHFEAARVSAERAIGATGHPSLGLAGLLPLAGENVEAAAAVAEASRATADAGGAMVQVARALRWSDIGLPASDAAGSLDLAAFEAAAPGMDVVADRLADALTRLEDAGGDRLFGPVASGYRDAVQGLERRADLAGRLRDTLRLVPAMFGGDRPRRYLLSVPALGVPRPGGGAPASVGILTARGGVLELVELSPAAPALTEAPTSVDWPTTAKALIEAAGGAGFPRLHGAILLDAAALEDLVWVTGDVPVEGRDLPLSDRTTATALEIEAFLGISPARTSLTHSAWASEILSRFLSARPAVESLALAAAAGARDRHLSVYLVREEDQRLVRSLGLDGGAELDGRGMLPVAATWTATSPSHVGALVETTVREDVRLQDDGSAAVQVEVIFENGAGTDVPSILLGRPASGFPVGTFAADVSVLLPGGARNVVAETSRPSPIEEGRALGLETVTGSVVVRGGESATLTVTYRVDEVVVPEGDTKSVVLRLLPQPTIDGVLYQIRLIAPDQATIASASRDLERRGQTALFTGVRSGPLDLELRYT